MQFNHFFQIQRNPDTSHLTPGSNKKTALANLAEMDDSIPSEEPLLEQRVALMEKIAKKKEVSVDFNNKLLQGRENSSMNNSTLADV